MDLSGGGGTLAGAECRPRGVTANESIEMLSNRAVCKQWGRNPFIVIGEAVTRVATDAAMLTVDMLTVAVAVADGTTQFD